MSQRSIFGTRSACSVVALCALIACSDSSPSDTKARMSVTDEPAVSGSSVTEFAESEQPPSTVAAASEPAGVETPEESFTYQPLDPSGELIEPIPEDVEDFFEDYLEIDYVPERIALGSELFHDPRLSVDNTVSCASCHDLRYGGIDRAVTATGVRSQVGGSNTPTVYNAAFNVAQFWDGRAADLEQQAGGPPLAAKEMASDWDQISAKLMADARMMEMLKEAYPDADFSEGIEPRYFLEPIADFERTLITPNSPFDRYLRGDEDAISEAAKEGYQVFKDVGCIECHNGVAIGGKSFQVMGRKQPYFDEHTAAMNLGRFAQTGNPNDKHAFKVGNLRNIALTAPYLHDGSQPTLESAVHVMAQHQLDLELSDGQTQRIVAFLETLTGEFGGVPLDEMQNTVQFPNSGH
ncbi:MAG: cytochrome c peroxidase [Planctomycetota bacterium]